MQIGVPREIIAGERRVAVVPEVVPLLLKAGHVLSVERGAGIRAGFTDDAYREAGAQLAKKQAFFIRYNNGTLVAVDLDAFRQPHLLQRAGRHRPAQGRVQDRSAGRVGRRPCRGRL